MNLKLPVFFFGLVLVLLDSYFMVCVWSWAQQGDFEAKYPEVYDEGEIQIQLKQV